MCFGYRFKYAGVKLFNALLYYTLIVLVYIANLIVRTCKKMVSYSWRPRSYVQPVFSLESSVFSLDLAPYVLQPYSSKGQSIDLIDQFLYGLWYVG